MVFRKPRMLPNGIRIHCAVFEVNNIDSFAVLCQGTFGSTWLSFKTRNERANFLRGIQNRGPIPLPPSIPNKQQAEAYMKGHDLAQGKSLPTVLGTITI